MEGINAGQTLNSIVSSLKLPTELMTRPYLVRAATGFFASFH